MDYQGRVMAEAFVDELYKIASWGREALPEGPEGDSEWNEEKLLRSWNSGSDSDKIRKYLKSGKASGGFMADLGPKGRKAFGVEDWKPKEAQAEDGLFHGVKRMAMNPILATQELFSSGPDFEKQLGDLASRRQVLQQARDATDNWLVRGILNQGGANLAGPKMSPVVQKGIYALQGGLNWAGAPEGLKKGVGTAMDLTRGVVGSNATTPLVQQGLDQGLKHVDDMTNAVNARKAARWSGKLGRGGMLAAGLWGANKARKAVFGGNQNQGGYGA